MSNKSYDMKHSAEFYHGLLVQAEAENERLRASIERDAANHRHANKLALLAQSQLEPSILREGALEAKLTKLRAFVIEHHESEYGPQGPPCKCEWCAAIEASL